ncbi:hypothetical protein B0H34DRAFT_721141 [Crassisporium funariophilum]|nr:hypothetical protein B0H34DRAFT_721141 [Crassisporium funariophilum]
MRTSWYQACTMLYIARHPIDLHPLKLWQLETRSKLSKITESLGVGVSFALLLPCPARLNLMNKCTNDLPTMIVTGVANRELLVIARPVITSMVVLRFSLHSPNLVGAGCLGPWIPQSPWIHIILRLPASQRAPDIMIPIGRNNKSTMPSRSDCVYASLSLEKEIIPFDFAPGRYPIPASRAPR